MPWTASDASKHVKDLTPKQQRAWAHIANSVMRRCQQSGGTECDARAMRQAAAACKRITEASTPDEVVAFIEESLRLDDSFESIRQRVAHALYHRYQDTDHWPWIENLFPSEVVYVLGDQHFRCSWQDGDPMVKLGEPTQVEIVFSDVSTPAAEADVAGDCVNLVERAISPRDGTIEVKLIQPGQGSSGYYPKEVLRRDGPKVFKSGTKMFIDHPTETEEADRPEGSIKNLGAELVEDARWDENHREGPGLYSRAKVFSPFKETLDELAPHIGVSIRASGKFRNGQVGGKPTRIVEELTRAASVDFVTSAGAGGKVISLLEAARSRKNNPTEVKVEIDDKELQTLREAAASVSRLNEEVAQLRADKDRLQEVADLNEAKSVVGAELGKHELTDRAKARVQESVLRSLPKKDGKLDSAALTEATKKAAEEEIAYLAEATGTKVKGMGATQPQEKNQLAEADKTWKDAFARISGRKEGK